METYKEIVLSEVPRALGLGDRNKNSKTFGCFDRYYWHYKLVDFPNVRFQETTLLLALLYRNKFPGNRYWNKDKLVLWIKGAIGFWAKIQLRDGSFNECWPNEHSFLATASSTYAITEAMLIIKEVNHLANIKRAGNWLAEDEDLMVSNHMAYAIVALHNIYLITGQRRYRLAAKKKVKMLLDLQDEEGFFPEYDGFDIGYLSVCLSYAAKYWKNTKDRSLGSALNKAMKFIASRVRENGSYDYAGTSRNTQYLYPHGLKIMQNDEIIKKHLLGLKRNEIINPCWMDDRFFIPLTIDYLQTYLE